MAFGANPLSTTILEVNQFPTSAVYVANTANGDFTALEGGPTSTDGLGNKSAPMSAYVKDGGNVALGTTTDASSANTLIGIAKAIKANTASVTIGSGTITANQGGTWTVTANIGTTNGLALDTSINGLLVTQGSATSGEKGPMVQGAVTTSAPIYTNGQTSPISLTPSGAIRVDASSTTQPVSGTFWQGTQPISVASLPLPSGAATSTKQAALGTAGSASSDVLSVQGIASMTALKIDGSAVTQPISGTITATQSTGTNLHTVVDSGAITATTNADTSIGGTSAPSKGLLLIGKSNDGTPQYQPLPEGPGGRSIIVEGNASATAIPVSGTFWQGTQPISGTVTVQQSTASSLKVDLSGTAANATALKVDGSAVTQPISGSVTVSQGTGTNLHTVVDSGTVTANAGTGTFNNQQSNVTTDYDTGAGTQTMTLFGVALPASGGAVAGGTSSNPLRTDPTGTTTQPISAASLPLPSGAATSAKQPALGTAGSASSDVLTVQGVASMTPLKVDGSGVTQPVSGTVTVTATNLQTNLNQIAGSAISTAATGILKVGVTDGSGTVITSTSNALDVNIKSGGGSGFSVTDEASWTAGTSALVPTGGVFNDSATALTSGQEGSVRLTTNRAMHTNIRSAGGAELATGSNPLRVDPTGTTTQPVSGTITANQGGTWTIQPGNTANTTPWLTTINQGGNSATVTGSNALKVDGSAVTQPISGTITANAGSGTFTNQQSNNTADYDTGAGTQTMTMFGLALPASGGSVAGGTSGNPVRTDPTGTTTQPVSGTVTANAGSGTYNIQSNASVNVNQVAGSSVATAATGIQKVGLTDGSGNAITSTGNAIDVNVKSGSGSGFSVVDEAAWTAGSSSFVPTGGVFNDSATALTSGQQGSIRLTNNRAIHVNLRDASANQLLGSKTSANSLPVVIASDQGAVAVSGTVTANAGSGSFTVAQATGSNLHAVLDSGSTTAVTQATASNLNAQVVGGVASAGSNSGNPVKVGGAFNTTQPTVTNGQIVDAQMTARGAQIVATGTDSFAVNASQSGTWNLTNISGTVSLPTGAATSAKQPALGTAGSASSDVLTVQGIASMTALKVDGSAVTQPVSGTVTANAGSGSFTVAQATGSNLHAVLDSGSTTAVTQATASNLNAQVVGTAASGASNAGNPVKVGGAFNSTQPTVTNGQAVDAQMTARGAQIVATGVDTFSVSAAQSGTWNITNVSGTVSLPTGASTAAKQPALGTAGSASADVLTVQGIASMTALKVDGSAVTQPVSGTVTANIGTSGSLALDATVAKLNVAQGAALGSNTGPMLQGSVTTNAPSYSTGNINPLSLDTAGLLRASLKDTPSNTNNLNVNLAASAATVTVSASNLQINLNQIAGSSVSTAATGVQKVGIVGNAGATVDSTIGAGTAPTNAIVMGSVYNSSAPAPTNGQAMAMQADQAGNARMFPGIALATLSAWNSGTSLNATQNIFTNSGAEAVLVQLTQTTTLTAGAITFEVSYDGSTWNTIPASCVLDPTSTTFAQISLPYTVQASTNKALLVNMNGAQGLRIKLSTQITGSGAVTPNYALLPATPADTIIALSPTAANFNATVAQTGTWTVQPGNTANTTPWLMQPQAGTTGGSTPFHVISAASNNATSVKASAGLIYGYTFANTNASARYVKFYNKASAPAPATDNALIVSTVQVPGSSTVIGAIPEGLTCSTGIAFAAVVNISDTDNTSVGSGDLSIDIRYK